MAVRRFETDFFIFMKIWPDLFGHVGRWIGLDHLSLGSDEGIFDLHVFRVSPNEER
jgi:hypothetical protein